MREDRPKISSWEKLRKHLRRKYVPSNYKQQLYTNWSNLRQGTKSVADYIQEGKILTLLCEIDEPEELKIGRFLGCLREDLREKVEVIQNLTYEGACNSALIFEKSARTTYTPSRSRETSCKTPVQNTSVNRVTQQHRDHTEKLPPASKDKEVNLKDIMCFKCHGHDHYKRNCPNARAFTQREWAEIHSRSGPRAMLVHMGGGEGKKKLNYLIHLKMS